MKKMAPGEKRFVVKMIDKLFRVYDRANGSYPYQTPELGLVVQDVDKSTAEVECNRLNLKFTVTVKEARVASTKRAEARSSKAVVPDAGEEFAEVPDYGVVLSEEERKKYEEGLLEKVTY